MAKQMTEEDQHQLVTRPEQFDLDVDKGPRQLHWIRAAAGALTQVRCQALLVATAGMVSCLWAAEVNAQESPEVVIWTVVSIAVFGGLTGLGEFLSARKKNNAEARDERAAPFDHAAENKISA